MLGLLGFQARGGLPLSISGERPVSTLTFFFKRIEFKSNWSVSEGFGQIAMIDRPDGSKVAQGQGIGENS